LYYFDCKLQQIESQKRDIETAIAKQQNANNIVISGGKTTFNEYVNTYKKMGYTANEAIKLANQNYLSNKPFGLYNPSES